MRAGTERRGKGRVKIARCVRVRPSEPHGSNDWDEIVETLNVCRNGVYFVTNRLAYRPEMRLFVTYPYDVGHSAINQEYLGRVARIDELPDGKRGVAVELKMKINLGTKDTFAPGH